MKCHEGANNEIVKTMHTINMDAENNGTEATSGTIADRHPIRALGSFHYQKYLHMFNQCQTVLK